MLTRTDEFLLRVLKPKHFPYLFWTGITLFFSALVWFFLFEAPDQAEHNDSLGLKALVLVPIAAVLSGTVIVRGGTTQAQDRSSRHHRVGPCPRGRGHRSLRWPARCLAATSAQRLIHGDDSVILIDRLASKGPSLECRRSRQ
ncbi:MAG TPA: hypothetical protein VF062_03440 [Candidatus Limnocylindrales bacterium]